jgi:metal-responsive CopG/Arc/MetJ family transcriptional regulator
MSHVIKVSGVSDELLTRIDDRWKAQHFADRSEYVRDLIRRDILDRETAPKHPESGSIQSILNAVHAEVARRGISDSELAQDISQAVAETRARRKGAII